MDNKPAAHEEIIIKRQWIAVVAAFVHFASVYAILVFIP